MIRLSLCIPTYNEEKNLHLALNSAADIVDEVVIIDGGSTDRTVEIAKSYGPKVVVSHVDNPPNFLKNKQRAIEAAKGEWILQLDADEAVTPELKAEIKKILENPQDDGYWIPRKNYFLGRFLMKGGVYPDAVLRLYKKEKAHFALVHVHEHAIIDGKVGTLKGAMEHWADPTFERYLTRWNRYTTFDAQELAKEGAKLCFGCYFIGKPIYTFFLIYFRHLGFKDGFPGFVWALFSSIRFWVIYIKWRQYTQGKKQ
jgi:glycosyltransferase involved in cell wall biosynthesis